MKRLLTALFLGMVVVASTAFQPLYSPQKAIRPDLTQSHNSCVDAVARSPIGIPLIEADFCVQNAWNGKSAWTVYQNVNCKPLVPTWTCATTYRGSYYDMQWGHTDYLNQHFNHGICTPWGCYVVETATIWVRVYTAPDGEQVHRWGWS